MTHEAAMTTTRKSQAFHVREVSADFGMEARFRGRSSGGEGFESSGRVRLIRPFSVGFVVRQTPASLTGCCITAKSVPLLRTFRVVKRPSGPHVLHRMPMTWYTRKRIPESRQR